MLTRFRPVSVVLAGVLATAGSAIDLHGQAAEVVTEEQRFAVQGDVDLTLRTFDGSIEVRSWDRDEVLVRIDRRAATSAEAEALEVQVSQEGGRIVIEAPQPSRGNVSRIGPGRSVSFVVQAPREIALDARTGDGAIDVAGLAGSLALVTGDGSVRGERLEGRLRVRTGDGAIDVREAAGDLDVDTGDGSVRVDGRLERVHVHTGDGQVTLRAADGSAMAGDWDVTTGDGAITLELPAKFDGEIDARSGDGRVRADWARQQTRDDDEARSFRGVLGNGGSVISLRSGDGSINIAQR